MQDLDKFKNEMILSGKNVYVGHRYVPKIMGDWDKTQIYEPLTIVQYQGNSFTSRQFVPSGIEITDEEYWASTGNYNAQIEYYRQEVRDVQSEVENELNSFDERLSNVVIQVKSSGGDDTESLNAALDEASALNGSVYLPDNDYKVSLIKTIDNAKIIGNGETVLKPFDETVTSVLSITGDDNVLTDFNVEADTFNVLKPVEVIGNNNIIKNLKVYDILKRATDSMHYVRVLITVVGDYNIVVNNKTYNGYTGINTGGVGNKIIHNTIHDNITGIRLSASARKTEIGHNLILNNNVNHASGADGILGSRNVSEIWIHHNLLENNGEHGLYFQGDNSIIESNIAKDNYGVGIKLASYNTDLHDWNETVDGVYLGHDNIIRNNITENNNTSGLNTNSGIYLQSPLKNIIVEGNIVGFENGYGIRSVIMGADDTVTGTPYSRMEDITIRNNTVADNIEVTFTTGGVIEGNKCKGTINLNGNSSYLMMNAIVRNNTMKMFTATSSHYFLLKDNIMDDFTFSPSARYYEVIGNKVNKITENRNITYCRIFNDNTVKLVGKSQITTPSGVSFRVEEITHNEFIRLETEDTDPTTDYLLSSAWNTYLRDCVVSNNIFKAPENHRNMRFWAERCIFKDNIFLNNSNRNFDLYAAKDTFVTGNTSILNNSTIALQPTDTPTNTVVNNNMTIASTGEQGIITNNRNDWLA